LQAIRGRGLDVGELEAVEFEVEVGLTQLRSEKCMKMHYISLLVAGPKVFGTSIST
jgi:hypothetical protein